MFTKTMATLMDRKSAIPWDLLPKTFQEAIIITHELGLQYIWIDSLCIIQDDDSDWEKESMRMQTIYGRSKVTIAAVGSKDGNGGCFVQDNSTFQFTHGTPGLARPFAIRVCPSHNGYDHYPTLGAKQMPLFSRAWSFQEELLSPRVLYYGPEEVVFQCRTSLDCQCRRIPKERSYRKQLLDRAFNNSSVSESSFARSRIVEEYSGRFLTHETDKFPALSGLAKEFKNMGLGDYVAGMWTTELPLRLGWRCRSVGVGPRTDVYLAPTWSWASLKAGTEVLYPHFGGGPTDRFIYGNFQFYLEILDISIKYVVGLDSDPSATLRSGHLLARERVLRAKLWRGRVQARGWEVKVLLDTETADTRAYCLLLSSWLGMVHFLVLIDGKLNGQCERCGTCGVEKVNLTEDCEHSSFKRFE
jgi:hypothetical protein